MYRLTYQGPSDVFLDPTSGTRWAAGESHDVDEATARRCCPRHFEEAPEPPRDPRLIGGPLPKEPPSPHAARWLVEEVKPRAKPK